MNMLNFDNIRAYIVGWVQGLAIANADPHRAYKFTYPGIGVNVELLIGINMGIAHVDGNIQYAAKCIDKVMFDVWYHGRNLVCDREKYFDVDDLAEFIFEKTDF